MIPFEDHDIARVVNWLGPKVGGWFMGTPAVRVPCNTEDEWLDARRNGIGASEVGVIVGASSWASPYALWYRRKLGWRLPRTEAQRWGHLVEDPIAELFAEQHDELLVLKPIGHPYSLWAHPVQTWMMCTPDRLVVDMGGNIAPVELKSDEGGNDWGEPGTDQVPLPHYIQVSWQAHIFGADGGWVVRKKGSGKGRLTAYWVPYDKTRVLEWETLAAEFLVSIERDKPPPPDGHKSTTETLKEVNPAIDAGTVVDVPGTLRAEWRMARINKQVATRREAEASNKMRAAMGRAEFAAVHGEVFAKRAMGKRAGYSVAPGTTDELRKVGSEQRTPDGRVLPPGGTDPEQPAGATPPEEGAGDGHSEGAGLGNVVEAAARAEDPRSDADPGPDALDDLAAVLKEAVPHELAELIDRALNGDPTERIHVKRTTKES